MTEKQDISSTKNMRPMLRDLGNVAARTGAAIVIIGHMNKGEKSKGIYRGLGSIDIQAAARSVLLIGKQKNDPNTRFMTQIKNNLSTFGKAVSFTINGRGKVEFLGECDIAEEDLLTTKLPKQSKFEIAKQVITGMLTDGDKKSNTIYDACMDAGISGPMMQNVKKRLGIKSVRKIDDWYWTMNPEAEDADGDDIPDTGSYDYTDETPVTFLENSKIHIPFKRVSSEYFKPGTVTMPSPFGELTLIDWRACV